MRVISHPSAVIVIALAVVACSGKEQHKERAAQEPRSQARTGDDANESRARKITLGLVPMDNDTAIEQHLDTPGGIRSQCHELNELVTTVCCEYYEMGCELSFDCKIVPIEDGLKLTKTATYYEYSAGRPTYPINQGSVIGDLERFLDDVAIQTNPLTTIAFTRHPIMFDDEETRNPDNKLNHRDLRSHWLGLVLSEPSRKGGTRAVLDYYSCPKGLILSVAPVNAGALAQGLAELRSNTPSFEGKQLTGTGARDLFEMNSEGRLIPNRLGCANLSRK